MTEVYEHNPGDHEDPVAGPTWTVAIVGAALFVVSVLGTAALFYDIRDLVSEQKLTPAVTPADERPLRDALRAEQTARLDGPVRIEKRLEAPEGALVIPLPQAMTLMVEEAEAR